MSATYLQLIPNDPYYVPPTQAQSIAKETLRQLFSQAEIFLTVNDTTQFVDQGENFERVSCPFCDTDLLGWWQDAMSAAYETLFENLSITLPCCDQQSSLDELRYQLPAGFARFILSVRNPNFSRDLLDDELEPIEKVLNCKIKQIWASL